MIKEEIRELSQAQRTNSEVRGRARDGGWQRRRLSLRYQLRVLYLAYALERGVPLERVERHEPPPAILEAARTARQAMSC